MSEFSVGQYVELLPTIASAQGGSIESGRRAIVRDVDLSDPEAARFLVEFLSSERPTGQLVWLEASALTFA